MAAKITANPLERMRRSQGRRVRIAVVSCPRRLSGAGSPMNSFVKADTEAAVSFGPFIFCRQQRLVTRDGEPLVLGGRALDILQRSEEHTSELQSLMRISYAVFFLTTIHITIYIITFSICMST